MTNTPDTPNAGPETTPNPAGAAPGGKTPNTAGNTVSLTVTVNGQSTTEQVTFNTPDLLERVRKLDAAATVKIVAPPTDKGEQRVLLDGTKEQAVTALQASVVPADQIAAHVQRLVQFLADHSTLRAVGVAAICVDAEGHDTGFGFVSTTAKCTAAQAVSLVNCMDANANEFITKAKLDIPGRGAAKETIVAPTKEQVEALG